jgi:hypothetical protein
MFIVKKEKDAKVPIIQPCLENNNLYGDLRLIPGYPHRLSSQIQCLCCGEKEGCRPWQHNYTPLHPREQRAAKKIAKEVIILFRF